MVDYGLVSIITPSYNCSRYINETIQAIQSQTYKNWELLITDDCSTDNSIEVIKSYADKDPRIKFFSLEKNGGAGVARNNSIKEAKGRYIAFCDSDDRWLPEKLQKQLALMDEKNCGFCFGAYNEYDEEDNFLGFVPAEKTLSMRQLKHCNVIGCLTAIYDTELVGKIYMPTIRKRQDWALWIKVLQKCKVAYSIQEPIALYRVRANSISRNKLDLVKYNAAVYEQVFNYPHWFAMIYTCLVNIPSIFIKKSKTKK